MLETKFFLRSKEAFFFGIIFPLFLFFLFGNLWGEKEYLKFLLTGVIGMTISADAFFGVGPVIKTYKDYGILKLLKILPFNPIYHFTSIFISRIICSFISLFFLILLAILFFKMKFSFIELFIYLLGIIIGIFLFSFFSLSISLNYTSEGGRGIINFLYFIMLFFSGTFYPLEIMPDPLKILAYLSPLTYLNYFLRGNFLFLLPLSFLCFLFMNLSIILFKKIEMKR
ncbi:MAG: ABC transporter permease [candidate division WOR-3 bacterium]